MKKKKNIILIAIFVILILIFFINFNFFVYGIFGRNNIYIEKLVNKNIDAVFSQLSKVPQKISDINNQTVASLSKNKTITGEIYINSAISSIDETFKPLNNFKFEISTDSDENKIGFYSQIKCNDDSLTLTCQEDQDLNKIIFSADEIEDSSVILNTDPEPTTAVNYDELNNNESSNALDFFIKEILNASLKLTTDPESIENLINNQLNKYSKEIYSLILEKGNLETKYGPFNKIETKIIIEDNDFLEILDALINKLMEDPEISEYYKNYIIDGESVDEYFSQVKENLKTSTFDKKTYFMITIKTNILGTIKEQKLSTLYDNLFEEYGYNLEKNKITLYKIDNYGTEDQPQNKKEIVMTYVKNNSNLFNGIIEYKDNEKLNWNLNFSDIGFLNNFLNGTCELKLSNGATFSLSSNVNDKSIFAGIGIGQEVLMSIATTISENTTYKLKDFNDSTFSDYTVVNNLEEFSDYIKNLNVQKYVDTLTDENYSYYFSEIYNKVLNDYIIGDEYSFEEQLKSIYDSLM